MSATATRERPIIFSGKSVRAILDGRKTQTRRVITPQLPDDTGSFTVGRYHPTVVDRYGDEGPGDEIFGAYCDDGEWGRKCPFGTPGDRLWVRTAYWYYTPPTTNPANEQAWDDTTRAVRWRTGETVVDCQPDTQRRGWKKRPPIHMPRWASRLTLDITDVRVERLQDIGEADAIAEGCGEGSLSAIINAVGNAHGSGSVSVTPRGFFSGVWDALNAKRGFPWDRDPWVWVISFSLIAPEVSHAE